MKRIIFSAELISLFVVLLVAFCLRIYHFGSIPNGVNRDEASIGYTAWLLLKTGHEEHAMSWPLRFESFGDWKQPLYIYLVIPMVALFGLSAISVRVVSLFSSMVMIVVTYLLTRKITSNHWSGIVGALLLSLNPWHFHFSHLALETMVASTLFIIGIWYLMMRRQRSVAIGIACFWLSLFTYHASLIVIPMWLIGYLLLYRELLKQKYVLIPVTLFFMTLFLIGMQAWFSPERAKATGTTIFSMSNETRWQSIYQYRTKSISSKLLHNQITYFVPILVQNYIRSFSPQFLITQGGTHPHYNVPGYGNFSILEIILCVLGIVFVILKKSKQGLLLLLVVALAPIPAAITKDAIHSTREFSMIPSVQILAALGFAGIMALIKSFKFRIASAGLLLGMLLITVWPFYRYYFGEYRAASDRLFTGYMQDISLFMQGQKDRYLTEFVTYPFESPYIFYAFYTKLDPHVFLKSVTYYPVDQLGFRYAHTLGNMNYIASNKDLKNISVGQLSHSLIFSRVNEVQGLTPIKTWKDLEGNPEIAVYEGTQLFQ